MSTQWHYSRDGASAGPITTEELKQLVSTGKLSASDLVWKTGMTEWSPVGKITGLFDDASASAVALAVRPAVMSAAAVLPVTGEPSQIGYFSNISGLPERAAVTLKGFAAATGDRGVWPLDDQQLSQLRETERHRRKIRNAVGLYRGLFALSLIAAVCFLIGGAFAMAGRRGGGSAVYGLGVALAISGGLSVLYYFAATATKKCHRWAPLTLLILFLLGIAIQLVMVAIAASSGGPAAFAAIVPAVLGMILPAAFAYASWQAYSGIQQFLACPMWCQEALVNAKL